MKSSDCFTRRRSVITNLRFYKKNSLLCKPNVHRGINVANLEEFPLWDCKAKRIKKTEGQKKNRTGHVTLPRVGRYVETATVTPSKMFSSSQECVDVNGDSAFFSFFGLLLRV